MDERLYKGIWKMKIEYLIILLLTLLVMELYICAYLLVFENDIKTLNGHVDLKSFRGYCDYGWSAYQQIRPGCENIQYTILNYSSNRI